MRRVRVLSVFFFFFFKQKTAYEMRISDWSSDVCSSDLTSLPTGHIETLELGRRRLLCSRHIGPDRNGIALRIDMRAPDYLTIVDEAQDISDIRGRYAGKCRFFTVWHEAPLRPVGGPAGWDIDHVVDRESTRLKSH